MNYVKFNFYPFESHFHVTNYTFKKIREPTLKPLQAQLVSVFEKRRMSVIRYNLAYELETQELSETKLLLFQASESQKELSIFISLYSVLYDK